MRAALIRDGIVENIIIAGEGFDPGEGFSVVPIGDLPVSIGYTYGDGEFHAPETPEAPEVSPEELIIRQALEALGLTPEQIEMVRSGS